jgi:hypothetical protein
MFLPPSLHPTTTEVIELPSGRALAVPKCTPRFQRWEGPPVLDTYNGKQVLDVDGKPAFAELAILMALRETGWDGVWIDTYGRAYRTGYWDVPPLPSLPKRAAELLATIHGRTGSRDGAWDVFCWMPESILFAESKRSKKDSIRDSQRAWLEAAVTEGLKSDNFLVVEWSLGTSGP